MEPRWYQEQEVEEQEVGIGVGADSSVPFPFLGSSLSTSACFPDLLIGLPRVPGQGSHLVLILYLL